MANHKQTFPGEHSQNAQEFWDEMYTNRIASWRGNPNVHLVNYAQNLNPGHALDIGCGDSGDAIWLAKHGWQVTSVDISPIVLARAKDLAIETNVEDSITYVQQDLTQTFPRGDFDLISAQFFHSPIEFDRANIFKQAANALNADGILLIVDHGAVPPWSDHHDHEFPSGKEIYEELKLDSKQFSVDISELIKRESISPDGEPAILFDNIITIKKIKQN